MSNRGIMTDFELTDRLYQVSFDPEVRYFVAFMSGWFVSDPETVAKLNVALDNWKDSNARINAITND